MDTERAGRYAALYRLLSEMPTATEEQRREFRRKSTVYDLMFSKGNSEPVEE